MALWLYRVKCLDEKELFDQSIYAKWAFAL